MVKKNIKLLPDSEGVWCSVDIELPPIVVLYIYGELKWTQIGFSKWDLLKTLKQCQWEKMSIPYFEKYGR